MREWKETDMIRYILDRDDRGLLSKLSQKVDLIVNDSSATVPSADKLDIAFDGDYALDMFNAVK